MPETMWKETSEHIYNVEAITGKVYIKPIRRGKIYLRDEENFPFTVSCGASSERSFSGCFYGHTEIKTLQDAMTALDKQTF